MVVSAKPDRKGKPIETPMDAAMKAFNDGHCSTHECVARAIKAYNSFTRTLFPIAKQSLVMDIAEFQDGGIAVVISGFKNSDQAVDFMDKLNA